MRFAATLPLVAITGFIALSYEILWVRVYMFVSGGLARMFGVTLGFYLLGLALGSLWSLRHQDASQPDDPRHLRAVAGFVLAANLFGYLLIPLLSWLVVVVPWFLTFPLVAVGAALLGATLPLLCHFAIPADERSGERLGILYLANIVGSGAGSLLTGFVLLDAMTMAEVSTALVAGGTLVAVVVYAIAAGRPAVRVGAVGAGVAIAALALVGRGVLFDGLWERLQRKGDYEAGERFTDVIESRHGVITVDDEGVVYGGGVYDGDLTTVLRPGSWLVRPYILGAVHPAPKDVLEIGMSGGAWTQILAHHPDVEHVTAVEISPSYLELIRRYDPVRSVLTNPKVDIEIDDGRRWLVRHPDARFDVIVCNMTWHWREHATHLLSREFMELVRSRLKPGGVYLFNPTWSEDVIRTATEVFPYTIMVVNNVLASADPIHLDRERWRRVLSAYAIDGEPVFDLGTASGRTELEGVLAILDTIGQDGLPTAFRLRDREQMLREVEGAEVVTDDNLGAEY